MKNYALYLLMSITLFFSPIQGLLFSVATAFTIVATLDNVEEAQSVMNEILNL